MTTETTETPNDPAIDALRETVRAEFKAAFDDQQTAIQELIADEIANVPEHVKKLIPDALAPIEQIRWLRKAKESGLFAAPTVAATDSRRPSNTPKPVDPATLSPISRIAAGYTHKGN